MVGQMFETPLPFLHFPSFSSIQSLIFFLPPFHPYYTSGICTSAFGLLKTKPWWNESSVLCRSFFKVSLSHQRCSMCARDVLPSGFSSSHRTEIIPFSNSERPEALGFNIPEHICVHSPLQAAGLCMYVSVFCFDAGMCTSIFSAVTVCTCLP